MDRQVRVFERAVGSVVKIATGEGGGGTGFVVRKDGLILTAAHVVDWARVVQARDPEGREFPCRVIRSKRYEDVAALAVSPKAEPVERKALCLSDCSADEVAVGRPAIAIGNPSSCSDFTFSNGYISARAGGGKGGAPLLQMNMSVNWGTSGGPVMLLNGKVLGMAVQINYATNGQRNEGVAHAVPASFLRAFIGSVPDLRKGIDGTAYCSACGNLVPEGKHCGHCGARLAPIEDEERAVAKIFGCPTCGRAVAAGDRFCKACGTDLRPERKGR